MAVWIEAELCNGCRRCLKACPYQAVEMRDGKAHILDRCTACGACIRVCKQNAVMTDAEPRIVPDFTDYQGIWVFAEQKDCRLNRVSLELLGKAQDLAEECHQEVSAVLLGYQVMPLIEPLMAHGADNVFVSQHRALKDYRTTAYAKVLAELVETHKPNILLMGATPLGRDLAPRLSRRVEVGLTADCTALTLDPQEGILLQTRPAFGGNVMATIANRYSRPQMATVRPGVMTVRKKPGNRGRVIRHKALLREKEIGTKILEIVRKKRKAVGLHEASIIVGAGRGVGSKKGMTTVFNLAAALGGEVAGTRIIVEEGWLPPERQVGQTGQTVRPEIYLACGISGAIQHRAGIMGSRYIIAVNRDKRAPIFEVADWGIVGDLHKVAPALIKAIKTGP